MLNLFFFFHTFTIKTHLQGDIDKSTKPNIASYRVYVFLSAFLLSLRIEIFSDRLTDRQTNSELSNALFI